MASYQVTLSEGGSPNCAGIYTEHVEHNGLMSYTCTNEAGTWYLSSVGDDSIWVIGPALSGPGIGDDYWLSESGLVSENYLVHSPDLVYSGTATVAEYVPPAVSSFVDVRVAHVLICGQCGARLARNYVFHAEESDATK